MSTFFYLCCRTCRRYVPLAAAHGGHVSGLAGDEWLRAFAVAHGTGHDLFSTSEYDEGLSDFVEVDDETANEVERGRMASATDQALRKASIAASEARYAQLAARDAAQVGNRRR